MFKKKAWKQRSGQGAGAAAFRFARFSSLEQLPSLRRSIFSSPEQLPGALHGAAAFRVQSETHLPLALHASLARFSSCVYSIDVGSDTDDLVETRYVIRVCVLVRV